MAHQKATSSETSLNISVILIRAKANVTHIPSRRPPCPYYAAGFFPWDNHMNASIRTISLIFIATIALSACDDGPADVSSNSIAGHTWRCDKKLDPDAGMKLTVGTNGQWERYVWDGDLNTSAMTWLYVESFVQDGNVVTATELDGAPAATFDVSIDGNHMQMTYRTKTEKPSTPWTCVDRPLELRLMAGAYYCTSYNSSLKGRAIDRSGNQYVQMPTDCARLDSTYKPEWSKTEDGITRFGAQDKVFYTWSDLAEY
jgi:hypothetical protein